MNVNKTISNVREHSANDYHNDNDGEDNNDHREMVVTLEWRDCEAAIKSFHVLRETVPKTLLHSPS